MDNSTITDTNVHLLDISATSTSDLLVPGKLFNDIQALKCGYLSVIRSIDSALTKTDSESNTIEILTSEQLSAGTKKLNKPAVVEHLIKLITVCKDVCLPAYSQDTNSKLLKPSNNLNVDYNQIVTDTNLQVIDNSAKLNSITNQLSTLSEAVENFRTGPGPQNPLSSSEALLAETEVLAFDTNKPASHAFKCFDDNIDNFISSDESQKLMDFFSKEDFNCEGGHGVTTYGAKYNYMGHKAQPKPIPGCIKSLMDRLNQTKTLGSYELNACLVNKYEGPESKLSEHSDNEYSINPSSDIFTISLGDVRKVIFRDIFSHEEVEHCPQANSLYVMSRDSQNFYQHRIDRDDSFIGVRYSLTFRSVHWRYLNSTCIIGDSNTKNIKFGSGKGTVGDSTPGIQVYAPLIEYIDTRCCASFSNVVISVGVNNLKDRNIGMNDVKDVYGIYKNKISEIKRLNEHCKIFVVPLLPTKMSNVNRKNINFNGFLFNDLLQSFDSVSIVDDVAQFVDMESGLLSESLSRYRADPLHLNSAGVGLLVRLIKNAIFQGKKSSKVHSNKLSSSAVSRRPP